MFCESMFLGLSLFFTMLPLYSCLVVSLKSEAEMTYDSLIMLPENFFNFENYTHIWQDTLYAKALAISLLLVILSVGISALLSAMLSFVLFRVKIRGANKIFNLFAAISFVPTLLIQVFCFQMMAQLKLVNTIIGYVLLLCNTDITALYVFRNNYKAIPVNYDNLALIEGSSYFMLFVRVHIPQLKPAFITYGLIKAIFVYNEYVLANLYLLDKSMYPTVTTVLYALAGPFGSKYNIICAGVILSLLPILILFLFFQKKIYSGFSHGGMQ